MFIRDLDEKEKENEIMAEFGVNVHIFPQSSIGQSMRWSRFKDREARKIFDIINRYVFPAIKNMKNGVLPDFDENGEIIETSNSGSEEQTAFARYMKDATFVIPTPMVLQKIITGLEDLFVNDVRDMDRTGDVYEYMLDKLSTAGQNGQFRTPKHIRDMMVELVAPTPKDTICEKT